MNDLEQIEEALAELESRVTALKAILAWFKENESAVDAKEAVKIVKAFIVNTETSLAVAKERIATYLEHTND